MRVPQKEKGGSEEDKSAMQVGGPVLSPEHGAWRQQPREREGKIRAEA